MTTEFRDKEPPSEQDMQLMREAHSLLSKRLLSIPGVHGVGIGYKTTNGRDTGKLAVVALVHKKLPRSEVDLENLIPPEFRFYSRSRDTDMTIVTDVQEQPPGVEYSCIADNALITRTRPTPGGYQISRPNQSWGTLGGWVWDVTNDQVVLLTNNHVLGGTAGVDVVQPAGSYSTANHLADVVRTGTLDATIAAPRNDNDVELEIEGIGPAVYEITQPVLKMAVEKSGAKTEHTEGEVYLVNLARSHYGSTNDFDVRPITGYPRFAYYGDSGSLIVEKTNPSEASWKRVVGLLYGGVPELKNAYGHVIGDVFTDLNLTTICAGIVEAILEDIFDYSTSEYMADTRITQPQAIKRPALQPIGRFISHRLYQHVAKDFEKQVMILEHGPKISKLIHKKRVDIVELAYDREIQRALFASVTPFIRGAWTTREVMNRVVTDEDAERFEHFLNIVEESKPNLKEELGYAREIIAMVRGNRFTEVLNK